jgi:hypothetical protein
VGLAELAEVGGDGGLEVFAECCRKYPFSTAYRCRSWTLSVGTIFVVLYHRAQVARRRPVAAPSTITIRMGSPPPQCACPTVNPKMVRTSIGGKICDSGGAFVKPLWLMLEEWGDAEHSRDCYSTFPCISNLEII